MSTNERGGRPSTCLAKEVELLDRRVVLEIVVLLGGWLLWMKVKVESYNNLKYRRRYSGEVVAEARFLSISTELYILEVFRYMVIIQKESIFLSFEHKKTCPVRVVRYSTKCKQTINSQHSSRAAKLTLLERATADDANNVTDSRS